MSFIEIKRLMILVVNIKELLDILAETPTTMLKL
jgi:hypothetical protein